MGLTKRLLVLFVALLVLSSLALAEDVLIYESYFSDQDSRDVYWDPVVGDWEASSDGMTNYDTVSSNTICSQELDQLGEQIFVYEYKMYYDQAAAAWAPLAGLHFMATDDTSANRGDSYLMWHDNENIQFYKGSPDGLVLLKQVPGYPVIVGDQRVVRVEYNANNGEIKAYVDGSPVMELVDTEPLVDGSFISLRTSLSAVTFEYVKVWVRK